MRRGLGSIFLALVVVLAGCSGVFGDSDEPPETLTPAAVPTDRPTPTPVPQFAPGLTGEGIEDPNALLYAHTSVLENRSFTMRTNRTAIAPNGSVVVNYTSTLRAGPPGTSLYSRSERNGNLGYTGDIPPVRAGWSNDTFSVRRGTYPNGTTTYDRFRTARDGRSAFVRSQLRYALEPFGTANTSVSKRERNGTTLYLVRGKIRHGERFGQGNMNLRLVVDSRGIVRETRTVTSIPDENVSRVVTETRFSGAGTTDAPERPSWVDDALSNTTPFSRPTAAVETVTATNRTTTAPTATDPSRPDTATSTP